MKKYFLFSLFLIGALLYASQFQGNIPLPGRTLAPTAPISLPTPAVVTRSMINEQYAANQSKRSIALPGRTLAPTSPISLSTPEAPTLPSRETLVGRSAAITATASASTSTASASISPAFTTPLLSSPSVHTRTSLDVINNTGDELQLYVLNSRNQPRPIQTIPAANGITTVSIPTEAVAVYVQDTTACQPLFLGNSIQGIIITPSTTISTQYTLQLLTPTFNNNYIMIYNQSTNQNTAILQLIIPNTHWYSLASSQIRTFSKILQPGETYLMEIPNITTIHSDGSITTNTPTQINFSIPGTTTSTPFPINTSTYNSFVITHDNNLIQN